MEKITNIKGKLLEGCIWDEKKQRLYFVDIECRKIYCFWPEENTIAELQVPDYIGCAVLEPDGKLIAALPNGLYQIDFERRTVNKTVDAELPAGIRYNDGKCGPDGKLWVGSMAVCQDEKAKGAGALFCIGSGGVEKTYGGFTIPNGMAWKKEEGWFYHIDTPVRRVDRYRMDKSAITDREMVADLRGEKGIPDGMCMDCRGKLWIAMWGGGQVICVDPDTGSVSERITVADKYVSCCVFGGARMDELFITTARDEEGNGGELYVQKMRTSGMISYRYQG